MLSKRVLLSVILVVSFYDNQTETYAKMIIFPFGFTEKL